MVSNANIKLITARVLKESFFNYYSTVQKETKHLVLDRLFPEQRRITSYMTGLQTSLGTNLWEKLAQELASNNGFTIISNSQLKKPNNIPTALDSLITSTKTNRETVGGTLVHFRDQLNILYPNAYTGHDTFSTMTKGKGSDLIIEKDDKVYIYDIKTVQINANSGNSFNETVILWIAYYKYQYGLNANDIIAKLVFPYNSSDETNDGAWWSEFEQRVKPLTVDEVDVGNEFWSFLTDNDTALSSIIEAIDDVSNDTNFMSLFEEVFSCTSQEDLQEFSKKVKIKRAEFLRNLSLDLHLTDVTSFGRKYKWKHSDECEGFIKARVKQLIDGEEFTCPVCECIL